VIVQQRVDRLDHLHNASNEAMASQAATETISERLLLQGILPTPSAIEPKDARTSRQSWLS